MIRQSSGRILDICRIIILKFNHRILALSHLKVFIRPMQSQCICFRPSDRITAWRFLSTELVCIDTNKSPFALFAIFALSCNETKNPHPLYKRLLHSCNVSSPVRQTSMQRQDSHLFHCVVAHRPDIFSSMSGIDDQHKIFCHCINAKCSDEYRQK